MKTTLQEVFAVCFKYSQLDTFLLEMAFYFTNLDLTFMLHYIMLQYINQAEKRKKKHYMYTINKLHVNENKILSGGLDVLLP